MARKTELDSELILRARWYIYLRWFLLLAITAPALLSLFIGTGLTAERVESFIVTLVALATNVVFFALSRLRVVSQHERRASILAISMLAFDVLFISYFIYSKGGIESRSELLYALPILMSAALFGRLAVYLTAIGSALAYDFVIIANYAGLIHSPEQLTHQYSNLTYVCNTVIFFSSILVLVGVLADFITRLLIRQKQAATNTAAELQRAQAVSKIGSWEWQPGQPEMVLSDELFNIVGVARTIDSRMSLAQMLELIHPGDKEQVRSTIRSAVQHRRKFSIDYRIVRRDATVRAMHTQGMQTLSKRGKLVQMYGTSQDITAERQLEAAKGDFVSLASHQLRTPASGVRMLLTMLRDGYDGSLTPVQLSTVEQAIESNERLLRIADDLLNVAKLEAGRMELKLQKIEACAWLKNVIAPHKLLAKERKQRVRLVVPKGTVYLSADPDRLAMVLDNLLTNASKYTPKNGVITIALQPGVRSHQIVVSDTGMGMNKTEIAKLFGKFTRLENHASNGTEGTGLGLYLAKSIIDLHHGTIRVSSRPGNGTTFSIRLPVKT